MCTFVKLLVCLGFFCITSVQLFIVSVHFQKGLLSTVA